MYYYWYYYLLGFLLIPGIILGVWAQSKVSTNFKKYSEKVIPSQTPANKIARHLLDSAGLYNTKIMRCQGNLTDHFNPKTNTVSLSQPVHDSCSISAIGVMAHELGHVMQYKDKYPLIKFRTWLIPIINFSSYLLWPLVILGIFLEFSKFTKVGVVLICIGVGIFALSTIISLITIPIEKDASKRAEKLLVQTGILSTEEYKGVKEILDSAALTYIAGLVTSILSLLRFLIFIISIRGRD